MNGFLFFVLSSLFPAFGYFPEPSKSFVVIGKYCRAKAEDLFHDLGVHVVRYLGIFIGDLHEMDVFVHHKVNKWPWVNYVHTFSDIALKLFSLNATCLHSCY